MLKHENVQIYGIYKHIVRKYSIWFKEYNFIIVQNTVSPPWFTFTVHWVVTFRWCRQVISILSQFVFPPRNHVTEKQGLKNSSVCVICSISRIIMRFWRIRGEVEPRAKPLPWASTDATTIKSFCCDSANPTWWTTTQPVVVSYLAV